LASQDDVECIYVRESDRAYYRRIRMLKEALLRRAFQIFQRTANSATQFEEFEEQSSDWLDDYAHFVVLKDVFGGEIWCNWPEPLRHRQADEMRRFVKLYREQILFRKFEQFVLWKQWNTLRDFCHEKGVHVMGDMPIYVETDSADVWTHPECFKLDRNSHPELVAGVPPDYFSSTGQLWGNPVYRWDVLQESQYSWWIDRLRHNLRLYDLTRIDHFRGLVQYWEVPAHEPTAMNGHWADVPSYDFLDTVFQHFDKGAFVAEDLGSITDDVRQVMNHYELAGMKILLFAFNGDLQDHPYLPHNYPENCVAYTGTHDNNTVRGWFDCEMTAPEAHNVRRYLNKDIDSDSISWDLIRLAWQSKSRMCLAPMQDLLALDQSTRMNTPGVGEGCWTWRCPYLSMSEELAGRLRQLTTACDRASDTRLGRAQQAAG
jgi:4-alpha-glucanotransferase